ncbi:hypothetical protein MBLNU459_g0555t1 [Dothideomycetes sp. NU459]
MPATKKAARKLSVAPINERSVGKSPTEILPTTEKAFRSVGNTCIPLRLLAVPTPDAIHSASLESFDVQFVDHAEILGIEQDVTSQTTEEIIKRSLRQKEVYRVGGESAESQRWHRRRVRKINEAAYFLIPYGNPGEEEWMAKMDDFARRRDAFLRASEEWVARTLLDPPGGYPYAVDTLSCGDPTCKAPPCCSVTGHEAKHFPEQKDAIERGCAVGTFKHDPLHAQRIVYASLARGARLRFNVGRYTVQHHICRVDANEVSRADLTPFPEFGHMITTHAELELIFETLQEHKALPVNLRSVEEFKEKIRGSNRSLTEIAAQKRSYAEAVRLVLPALPTGSQENSLPLFSPESRVIQLGIAAEADTGTIYIAKASVGPAYWCEATAEEAREVMSTDWRDHSVAVTTGRSLPPTAKWTIEDMQQALEVTASQMAATQDFASLYAEEDEAFLVQESPLAGGNNMICLSSSPVAPSSPIAPSTDAEHDEAQGEECPEGGLPACFPTPVRSSQRERASGAPSTNSSTSEGDNYRPSHSPGVPDSQDDESQDEGAGEGPAPGDGQGGDGGEEAHQERGGKERDLGQESARHTGASVDVVPEQGQKRTLPPSPCNAAGSVERTGSNEAQVTKRPRVHRSRRNAALQESEDSQDL